MLANVLAAVMMVAEGTLDGVEALTPPLLIEQRTDVAAAAPTPSAVAKGMLVSLSREELLVRKARLLDAGVPGFGVSAGFFASSGVATLLAVVVAAYGATAGPGRDSDFVSRLTLGVVVLALAHLVLKTLGFWRLEQTVKRRGKADEDLRQLEAEFAPK